MSKGRPPPVNGETAAARRSRTAPVREIVELACRAPSVHNTQPWSWRQTRSGLELHADRSRQLAHADPQGRNLVVSCGAALHHAQVAAAGLGWRTEVDRSQDPRRPDLLATVALARGRVVPEAEQRLDALRRRVTDRRRFTSWPLPVERLDRLATEAASWGAAVVPLVDPPLRAEVDRLLRRADQVQRQDETHLAELARWVGGTGPDGVPASSIPASNPRRPAMPSRFFDRDRAAPSGGSAIVDGLVALCTVGDTRLDWLRTGETLSALWLEAVRHGLSVVPLSQPVEVPETRAALRLAIRGTVGGDRTAPQLLLRLGWQEIARVELPRTPRRHVDHVLS